MMFGQEFDDNATNEDDVNLPPADDDEGQEGPEDGQEGGEDQEEDESSDDNDQERENASSRPKKVPYERFQAVAHQKSQAIAYAQEAMARAAELEARVAEMQAKYEKVPTPDEISPDNYETIEEYSKALRQAVAVAARKEAFEQAAEQAQAQAAQQAEAAIANQFMTKLQADAKTDPQVIQAYQHIDKAIEYMKRQGMDLHPDVKKALVMATDNPGHTIKAIATSKQDLQAIMYAQDPAEVARAVRRIYQIDMGFNNNSGNGNSKPQLPPMQRGIPKPARASGGGGRASGDLNELPFDKYLQATRGKKAK